MPIALTAPKALERQLAVKQSRLSAEADPEIDSCQGTRKLSQYLVRVAWSQRVCIGGLLRVADQRKD